MHPDRMRLAAEHLRITAQCLFESCTVNGQWDGEHPDEQQDCDEMRALADELDAHAIHEEEIWRMATAPQKPRTKAEQERAASMFATLSADLAREASNMPANPANAEDESCEGYHPDGLTVGAACLPNTKADLAPASGAQVQRLVGCEPSNGEKK